MIHYSSIGQEIRLQLPLQQMSKEDKINLFIQLAKDLDVWKDVQERDTATIFQNFNTLWDQ